MKQEYADWIEAHIRMPTYGNCREATEMMCGWFPELTRVRGHYLDALWGEREHWWCVAEDGSIVDPTASQFPSKGYGEYIPWDESQPEPTGRCPNCGGFCYDGRDCCSDNCYTEYIAYLNSFR